MILTIAKEQIVGGLHAVQNVVSSRSTLPVLSNVLLRAQGKSLELTATDLDVTIATTVEASVKQPGASTVPVKKMFGIIRELPDSEIELEVDDRNTCCIRAGASFYRIHGTAAEEFPPQQNFPRDASICIPQKTLRSMLRKTSFAVSTDETRFVLNGIFFSLAEGKLTLVATDGRRLALVEEEVEVPPKGAREFIIPSKAVHELERLLQENGDVEIQATESHAAFSLRAENAAPTVVTTKLVEGNYPNYRQVIPGEAKERITLLREELLHALRRAEIMTSEKNNSVKLHFTKNNLTITANTPELGEAKESLAINYRGRELAIAFNPRFLVEPLNALDQEEVYFELIDELSPGVLKVNGPFLYVVMPMRLS